MSEGIWSAIIAAFVATAASLLTYRVSVRSLRLESERLFRDRDRLDAEVNKLRAETAKLALEMWELERRRHEEEAAEIRELLKLFDRAAFDAALYSEDPFKMLAALSETRIALQTGGASLVRKREVAAAFREIRSELWDTETEVRQRYPYLNDPRFAAMQDDASSWERRRSIGTEQYYEAVRVMMDVRHRIERHLELIREYYHMLLNTEKTAAPSNSEILFKPLAQVQ